MLKRKNKNILLVLIIISSFLFLNQTTAVFNSTTNISNKFKTEKYSIKLDGNGGNYSSNSNLIINKNTVNLPSPTRKGYSFQGYSTSSNGNINYSNSVNVNTINNVNLYAKWGISTYSISYNLNGGSISGQKTSYTVEDTFTLVNPSKTGHSFSGWTGSNGNTKQTSVTVSKGTTGNLSYSANWNTNSYKVDVNPIIQNVAHNSGLSGFTFNVYINGTLVASSVTDWCQNVAYGSKVRVVANGRTGYNITANGDQTQTVGVNGLVFNPTWYDNIPPTITSFSVENLGYYDPKNPAQGWNVRVYINGYDNGTGVTLYQTWLTPYKNGTGGARKDGQERILKNVLYLNSSEGRTFCAYAIDAAGNEAEKCGTIKV